MNESFVDHVISHGLWVLSTTNPTFLLGCLKEKVYNNNLQTLDQLKVNTEEAVINIQPRNLKKVTVKRAQTHIDREGGFTSSTYSSILYM